MTSLKVYFWILWSPVGTMFGLVTFFFYFFYWSIVNLQCCVTFCYIAKYIYIYTYITSDQSLSHVRLCDLMGCSTPGLPVHHQLLESTQMHLHWVRHAIQPSHLYLLLLPPSVFPSIQVFSNESVLHIRWPKYWSFSFNISPSNEYSGQLSFSMDWLDLFGIQGTLKRFLQHHSSKASILQCSAFFIVQLSHPYMTTGNGPLTKRTFVGKVIALLLIFWLGWS